MATTAYSTVSGQYTASCTEKKSEFLAVLAPTETKAEADAFLAAQRSAHPDARHHCSAFRLFDRSERLSDDGEPQGTAGAPILEVLRKNELLCVSLVVTRYFGGILLGAAGLQRAYRAAAAAVVAKAKPFAVKTLCRSLQITVSYALYPKLNYLLDHTQSLRRCPPVFDSAVTVPLLVSADLADRLQADCLSCCGGQVAFTDDGERFEFL